MPKLDVQTAGPTLRYLNRKAQYTFKVTNTGDAPATNVRLSAASERTLRPALETAWNNVTSKVARGAGARRKR